MAKEQVFKGTMPKYLLKITANGFDMHRDEFEVVLKRGDKSLIIPKAQMPVEEYTVTANNEQVTKYRYYVCFDTEYFGNGTITAVVSFWIPDEDFPDNLRKIVHKCELTNTLPV